MVLADLIKTYLSIDCKQLYKPFPNITSLMSCVCICRHGFVEEKTDWIVSVTPAQQEEYIEDCFNASNFYTIA